MVTVGALTTGALATVDADGTVHRDATVVHWRVFVRDGWLVPAVDVPARQSRPRAAPAVHTAVRVPGGDAVERVYAVGDRGGAVVVEVENSSPEAIAVAFVLAGDEARCVSFSRPPGATEADGALAFPVPHRTSVRLVISTEQLDARALPDIAAVERGWEQVLDRGMRVELPEPLQHDVDAARADLLLAPPSAEAFALLEAWGFDAEATTMWSWLGLRARRAARRSAIPGVLGETRAALLYESDDGVDLLPGFRAAWLGQAIAVHDAPVRGGTCSFAVRWHGARPALLWDVPAGLSVRAPALDPAFLSHDARGETLLAEPPSALLPMGERAPAGGAPVEPPEQFT